MPDQTAPNLVVRKFKVEDGEGKQVGIGAFARSRSHVVPEGQSHNTILFAYRFTDAERALIAKGADFYVGQLAYQAAANEMLAHVGADAAALYYGVELGSPEIFAERRRNAHDKLATASREFIDANAEARALGEGGGVIHMDDRASLTRRMAGAYSGLARAMEAVAQANMEAGV